MTDVKPELSVTEALRLAATDAPELVARLRYGANEITDSGRILHASSLWPTKAKPVRVRPLRWRWAVVEQHDHDTVLAAGHRLTRGGAWRKTDKAARRIRDERAEARKAETER